MTSTGTAVIIIVGSGPIVIVMIIEWTIRTIVIIRLAEIVWSMEVVAVAVAVVAIIRMLLVGIACICIQNIRSTCG